MKKRLSYIIAGQSIEILTDYPDAISRLLPGFGPFCDNSMNEEGSCTLSKNGNTYFFTIAEREASILIEFTMEVGSPQMKYRLKQDYENGSLKMPSSLNLKFSMWMALAFTGIPKTLCAIHSSVIIFNNSAVLFLGESGTGKSTHTKLWLEHIAGSKLLNDDSPILSIDQEKAIVHGSPWSGKGQKYVNESYPVRAIVRIKQHPSNEMKKLNTLESFGALYPSFPPAFLKDNYFEGHICEIISKIISTTPIYLLHCLPNHEAAQMAMETIYK